MGSLSFSIHRGHVHWQVLLLVVSLFNFWCQTAAAEFAIVSTSVAEGQAALLPLRNIPPNVTAFVWYRGQRNHSSRVIAIHIKSLKYDIKGPAYSGRERINADGSLLIDKAYSSDEGMYTAVVYVRNIMKDVGFGRLIVYDPELVVSLDASDTTVTEDTDFVVFTCNTNAVSIQWLFNGMNLQLNERMSVSEIYQSLTIDPVKREDAGIYQCEVCNPITSAASLPVVLHVNLSDTPLLT